MDAAPRGGVPGSCGVFARIRWSLSPATTAERQTSSGGAAHLDVVRRAGPARLGPSLSHRAVGDLQRRGAPAFPSKPAIMDTERTMRGTLIASASAAPAF